MLTPLVCRRNPRQVCGACLRRFIRTHAAHTRWPCVRCAEPDDNRSLYARLKEQKEAEITDILHVCLRLADGCRLGAATTRIEG